MEQNIAYLRCFSKKTILDIRISHLKNIFRFKQKVNIKYLNLKQAS